MECTKAPGGQHLGDTRVISDANIDTSHVQGTVVAVENAADRMYGLQYHPEVQHSERGGATLRRFLFGIARIPADWKMENVLEEELAKIRAKVCYMGHAYTIPKKGF